MDEYQPSDTELVSQALKDQGAFIWIVRRYQAKLMRYVKMISRASSEETEDILQEVFIKVYRHLNEFEPSLKFSSWIYRIAHNEALNFRRSKTSRTLKMDEGGGGEGSLSLEFLTDMQVQLENEERGRQLMAVISSLKSPYREVAILRFVEEKNYEEISDILKKPLGTVATLINRVKERIKSDFFKVLKASDAM